MSTQTFSQPERYAIWTAHDGRCFYDGHPVRLKDMVVDHIVPESYLALSESERHEKLSLLGLASDYEILGYGNLVSCCTSCNLMKSSRLLSPQGIALSLVRTSGLIPRIEKSIRQQVAEKSLDKILHQISNQLDKGTFSSEMLMAELKERGIWIPETSENVLRIESVDELPSGQQGDTDIRIPGLIFANTKAGDDMSFISLEGVARLLRRIADGEATGDRIENGDGIYTYVVRAGGMYVKYAVDNGQIMILSCHLG